ncbi:MAG: NAD(P)/FAD-dependent oxidoreductase [Erysipelotrichaceae bacterium]|nr:NAD(P)/FAD-dependent oxidoreductase [Erysipelotrichaceae bacterium]
MDKNNTKTRIICIGAGASGLFFALNAKNDENEVILIDSNSKVGRKMYISGKGRCNITNNCDSRQFINNVVRNPKFLYSAINRFSPADTISFFNEHDCPLKTERGNRVFPVSDRSSDIIDCLFRECRRRKVDIRFDEKAEKIVKEENIYRVICKNNTYEADRLVIATGGKSYPSTGSTGDGYKFAREFGHKITELKSALCPIRIKEVIRHNMLDLTLRNVSLTCRSNRFDKTLFGDLEFLPGSISGPIALSMSSLINRLDEVEMYLDLKPALDEEKLDKRLLREIEKNPNRDLRYLLGTLLPSSFIEFFVENSATDTTLILNSLTKEKRLKLLNDLKHFKLTYEGLEDIEKGIVTSGGVDVGEIDPKTMESKISKGLYFIGEVLDVDAFTGGFNLQIALSTAYSCAINMN